ncbi:putative gustatory receptor 2a [Culicoides brevitarsis]|uniref:putative gustatory receptor 2a n=1 Tax=Culicoides brevitarsis TaxID=469753 RepID=UPI00307C56DC
MSFYERVQVIFQVFGMCPTSLKRNSVDQGASMIFWTLGQLGFVGILCFVASKNPRDFQKASPVNATTSILKEILVFGVHFSVILQSLQNRRQIRKFWNEIAHIGTKTPTNWKQILMFIVYSLFAIVIHAVILHSFARDPALLWHWLCTVFAQLVSSAHHLQFLCFLETIYAHCDVIAAEMGKICEQTRYNRSVCDKAITAVTTVVLHQKFARVRKVYHRLWRTRGFVNRIFGFGIMVNISYMFVSMIADLYWIYVSIYNSTFIYIVDLLLSIVVSIFYPYLSIKSSNKCLTKIAELNFMVNNVKRESSKELNEEVTRMSLKMFHPFTFTANDYFKINFGLMLQIFAGLLTHLIIIIQFMPAANTDSSNQWNQWGGKTE